jgi:hypothetical protein
LGRHFYPYQRLIPPLVKLFDFNHELCLITLPVRKSGEKDLAVESRRSGGL